MEQKNKHVILCVDDEKIILDSLYGQLQRKLGDQYYLEFAESADEAMEVINESIESGLFLYAIVSDWLMPGMKGDELLFWVFDKTPDTNLILLTGHVDNEIVKQLDCCNSRNIKCLSKPWKEEQLVNEILKK